MVRRLGHYPDFIAQLTAVHSDFLELQKLYNRCLRLSEALCHCALSLLDVRAARSSLHVVTKRVAYAAQHCDASTRPNPLPRLSLSFSPIVPSNVLPRHFLTE